MISLLALAAATHTLQMRYLMGTLFTIEADGPNAFAAADAAFHELHHLDDTLSTYKPESELSHANRQAGHGWTSVEADTAAVTADALAYAAESGGAFDPTVAPLVNVWGFKYLDYHVPPGAALARARRLVGYQDAAVDRQKAALRLGKPGMSWDLGAIAKGYAVDKAVTLLRQAGMRRIRVDAAGNQGVWSARPDHWLFGVKHPRSEGDILGAIGLQGGGISTSGDAERGFWLHGRRYGHILDPRSGQPVADRLSVTVVARTAEEADALSTALYVLGPTAGSHLLAHHPGCAALYVEPGSVAGSYRFTPTPGLDWHPAAADRP